MTRYIALLRGVNVGGVTIRSADLREVFASLGFDEVRTVLASGNVVFAASAPGDRVKADIERALGERFGYDAWIVLTTVERVSAVIDDFPFDAEDDERQPWVIFASDARALDELVTAASDLDPAVDPLRRGDGVLYWNPVKGTTGDTPFAKLLAKARYRPTTTNRNLRTLRRLV
ncbi:DUF1697 domain-containing protein [Agromyces rhizosphaerae]|nr:DUF1697 domain-containing protein [Agromyces rhizosphaerae]